MRSFVVLLALALSLPTAAALAAAPCPTVTPGAALGPITIGMTVADLEGLGLSVAPGSALGPTKAGPYEVWLTDGRVTTVGVDSATTACVRVGDAEVALADASLDELATYWPGRCAPLQINLGANVIACTGGLSLIGHRAGKQVRVTSDKVDVPVVCASRVVADAVARPRVAAADVTEGDNVCFGPRVFTHELVPDDVLPVTSRHHISTCERRDAVGATTLDCHYSGVRLIFTGPKQRLSRVESLPLRE